MKKRVMIITGEYPPDRGGVAVSVERIAHALRDTGVDLEVIVLSGDCRDQPVVTAASLPFKVTRFFLRCGDPATDKALRTEQAVRFLRYCQKTHAGAPIDLIHHFFPSEAGVLCGTVSHILGVPFLASFRGNDVYHALMSRHFTIARWVLQRADLLTFVNAEMAQIAGAFEPSCRGRCRVVHNSVSPTLPDTVEKSAYRLHTPPVIGSCGYFRAKKGVLLLPAALATGALQECACRLHLVGALEPSLRPHWDAKAKALGISDRIVETGFLDRAKVWEALSGIDVFVMPGLYDGCPNALLEAMCAGRPILCTRIPPFQELLVEGEQCLMHDAEDVDDAAACVRRLFDDDELRERLGRSARDRALSEYAPARELQDWLHVTMN